MTKWDLPLGYKVGSTYTDQTMQYNITECNIQNKKITSMDAAFDKFPLPFRLLKKEKFQTK